MKLWDFYFYFVWINVQVHFFSLCKGVSWEWQKFVTSDFDENTIILGRWKTKNVILWNTLVYVEKMYQSEKNTIERSKGYEGGY